MMIFRRPTTRGLLAVGRGAGIGGIAGMAPWAVAYLFVLHVPIAGLFCLLMVAVCSVLAWRSQCAMRALKARRPDYSLIASMERPIWGEAFEHAGAPATFPKTRTRVAGDEVEALRRQGMSRAEIARTLGLNAQAMRDIAEHVNRTHCSRCGSPNLLAAGRCEDCYGHWKALR